MTNFLMVAMAQAWYALLFFIYLNIDNSFLHFLSSKLPQPIFLSKAQPRICAHR
jgi:hypothetical protein